MVLKLMTMAAAGMMLSAAAHAADVPSMADEEAERAALMAGADAADTEAPATDMAAEAAEEMPSGAGEKLEDYMMKKPAAEAAAEVSVEAPAAEAEAGTAVSIEDDAAATETPLPPESGMMAPDEGDDMMGAAAAQ